MGGLTGLWLGRFAPERFYGLAVANTAARIGDQASWLSRARAVRQEGMAVVAAGAADRWFTHAFRQKAPEVVEALCHQLTHTDVEGYAACCEALAAADLRGEVGQIPLPTLIIAGESDPVTTVSDASFLQQQIPASQVVVLAASHLSNIEAPKALLLALLELLSRGNAMEDKQRYQDGMAVRRKVLGDAHVDRTLQHLTPLNDEFRDFITRYAWGETGPVRGSTTTPAA